MPRRFRRRSGIAAWDHLGARMTCISPRSALSKIDYSAGPNGVLGGIRPAR
jgi:hypothetical protein